MCNSHTKPEYKYWVGKIHAFTIEYDFEGWWKWWAPRYPHIIPALRVFNIPKMNMAETGQSKLKKPKKVWLSTATTADICEFTFQQDCYEKFLKNSEKIMGHGPSHKQCTQWERAEERHYVNQVCDLIPNGDFLDDRDDEEEYDFIPLKSAKHRPPKNLKKVPQERPTKKVKAKSPMLPNVNVTHHPKQSQPANVQPPSPPQNPKKLSPREGRGTNPQYTGKNNVAQKRRPKRQQIGNDDISVETENEFVKANRVFYIVLTPGLEQSLKQVTYCCGCTGKIKLHGKRFPNNMVFRYHARRMVPENGNKKKWVMSQE